MMDTKKPNAQLGLKRNGGEVVNQTLVPLNRHFFKPRTISGNAWGHR